MAPDRYIGVGLYSLPDAARIIQVKSNTLSRWVTGFTYRKRGELFFSSRVIRRDFEGKAEPLTFLEVIELLFVRVFRDHGVSMQTVRRAANAAADLFQTNHPFAVKKFDTDGRRIFVTLRQKTWPEEFVEEITTGQTVFESFVKPFFRKIEYWERLPNEARRYWPLGTQGRIVIDPEREFGQPIDYETGVPTHALYRAAIAEGIQRVEAVAGRFKVPVDSVRAAIEYEQMLSAA